MMFLLGVFAAGYGIHSLFAPPPEQKIGKEWVGVFGPLGGIFSAMFGSGGFVYAIYLSRRLDDKDAIRATQSTLIGMSTLTRVLLFLGVGHLLRFQLAAPGRRFDPRNGHRDLCRTVVHGAALAGAIPPHCLSPADRHGNDADRPRDRQRGVVTSCHGMRAARAAWSPRRGPAPPHPGPRPFRRFRRSGAARPAHSAPRPSPRKNAESLTVFAPAPISPQALGTRQHRVLADRQIELIGQLLSRINQRL